MRNHSPLVSIGLPTYNRGAILAITLNNLLSQSYTNFELLVSDNASSDQTAEICQRYAKKDARIHYFRQKNNIGMYNNFNFVLKKAKGKYFMWATDDDRWDKNFIKALLMLLEKHPDTVVATSNYKLFNDQIKIKTKFTYPEILPIPQSIEQFIDKAILITYGLVKTTALKKTGGFFIYPLPIPDGIGEHVSILRLLLLGKVAFNQKILLYKRDSGITLGRYKILKNDPFSVQIRQRIRRYCKFWILYLYDLYFMLNAVIRSQLSGGQKITVAIIALRLFVKNNVLYMIDLICGFGYFFVGCGKVLKHKIAAAVSG